MSILSLSRNCFRFLVIAICGDVGPKTQTSEQIKHHDQQIKGGLAIYEEDVILYSPILRNISNTKDRV